MDLRAHKKCPGLGGAGGAPTQAIGASFWPRREPKICLNFLSRELQRRTPLLATHSIASEDAPPPPNVRRIVETIGLICFRVPPARLDSGSKRVGAPRATLTATASLRTHIRTKVAAAKAMPVDAPTKRLPTLR